MLAQKRFNVISIDGPPAIVTKYIADRSQAPQTSKVNAIGRCAVDNLFCGGLHASSKRCHKNCLSGFHKSFNVYLSTRSRCERLTTQERYTIEKPPAALAARVSPRTPRGRAESPPRTESRPHMWGGL